ncbi:MAG: protein kinase [Planctomycetota bacterium]
MTTGSSDGHGHASLDEHPAAKASAESYSEDELRRAERLDAWLGGAESRDATIDSGDSLHQAADWLRRVAETGTASTQQTKRTLDSDSVPEIEGFEIHRQIGRGGMGVVYEATQIGLDRPVAIKLLSETLTQDSRAQRRFEIEVEAIASLDCDGVVPIHAVGRIGRRPYYVMQWIDGVDLQQWMSISAAEADGYAPRHGIDRIKWVIELGIRVARSLAYAHDLAIIHRDIKPANLLVDRSGTPWIIDFGLARIRGGELTQTADMLGSLRYMSPEQLKPAQVARSSNSDGEDGPPNEFDASRSSSTPVDHRTDIYSLGVTLAELITGQPVIETDSPGATVRAVLDPRRRALGLESKSLSQGSTLAGLPKPMLRDLETVLLKAIEPNASDRYATSRLLLEDLTNVLQRRPIRATRIGRIGRAWRWVGQNPNRATTLALLTGLSVILVLATLAFVTNRFANDNLRIREQFASLLDRRGVSALSRGEVKEAVGSFQEVVAATPFVEEQRIQRDRLDWLDQLTFKKANSERFPSRVYAWSRSNSSGDQLIAIIDAKDPTVIHVADRDRPSAHIHSFRGKKPIRRVRFSPDRRRLAILRGDRTNEDQELYLEDLASEASSSEPIHFDRQVTWMHFSEDGTRIYTCGWDGVLQAWQNDTGEEVARRTFTKPDGGIDWVYESAIDSNERYIAIALSTEQLLIVDAETFEPFTPEPTQLYDWRNNIVRWDPAGSMVAVGDEDGHLTLVELDSDARQLQVRLEGLPLGTAILDAEFRPDSQQLAILTADRTTHFFSVPEGHRQGRTLAHEHAVDWLNYDRDGKRLVVGGSTEMQIWMTETQQPGSGVIDCGPDALAANFVTARKSDTGVQNSAIDRVLRVTRVEDGTTSIDTWKKPEWMVRKRWESTQHQNLEFANFQNSLLVVGYSDDEAGRLRIQRVQVDDERRFDDWWMSDDQLKDVALFNASGEAGRLLTAKVLDRAYEWSVWNENENRVAGPFRSSASRLQLSQDGRYVLTGGYTKELACYAVNYPVGLIEPRMVYRLTHPNWTTTFAQWKPGLVITGCWDGGVRVWDVRPSEEDVSLFQSDALYKLDHRSVIECTRIDDDRLVVGTWNGGVHFWDLSESPPRRIIRQSHDSGKVSDVVVRSDGKRYASFGADATVRLWDRDGKQVATLSHRSPVVWAEFSPDGKLLASLSDDGIVQIWESGEGRPFFPTSGGPSGVKAAAWFNNKLYLAGTDQFGTWSTWLDK